MYAVGVGVGGPPPFVASARRLGDPPEEAATRETPPPASITIVGPPSLRKGSNIHTICHMLRKSLSVLLLGYVRESHHVGVQESAPR